MLHHVEDRPLAHYPDAALAADFVTNFEFGGDMADRLMDYAVSAGIVFG